MFKLIYYYNVKMLVTGQAQFLAVLYSIIAVIMVGTYIYDTIKNKFNAGSLLFVVIMLVLFVVLVYDTDCLRVGSCNTWSTIRTVLNAMLPIGFLIVYIMTIGVTQKLSNIQIEEAPKEEESS